MSFYDEIANDYEDITAQQARQEAADAFCERFVDLTHSETILDAGCGSGLYAMTFARMGLDVIGEDISESLLAMAKRQAMDEQLDVRWISCAFDEINSHVTRSVDAVVCMGNSLVHVLSDNDLARVMMNFSKVLNPAGLLAIQVLNYDRLIKQQERIVGVSRSGEKEFIRFYDYLDRLVRFNILTIDSCGGELSTHLSSTLHRPYRVDELSEACKLAGFEEPELFGDLHMGPYNPAESASVILLARKA